MSETATDEKRSFTAKVHKDVKMDNDGRCIHRVFGINHDDHHDDLMPLVEDILNGDMTEAEAIVEHIARMKKKMTGSEEPVTEYEIRLFITGHDTDTLQRLADELMGDDPLVQILKMSMGKGSPVDIMEFLRSRGKRN